MKRLALLLVIALASSARADDATDQANALDRHAWKLKLGGEVTVGIAAALLVATAVRVAVPSTSENVMNCGDPCFNDARVRDMGIFAGVATVAFAVGIPLLAYAHRDHVRAFQLRATSIAASF